MTSQPSAAPVATEGQGSHSVAAFWLIVSALGLAGFLGTLNNMSLAAFLPFIAEDLRHSVPALGQISTIGLLLGAASSLVIGPLADRFGVRRFLLIGAMTVIVTAVGTALATSYGVLLVARLVSAVSGGALLGIALSAAAMLFTGQPRRRAVSWIFAGGAVAPVVGVPALALIGSATSWRVAFVALALFAIVIAVLVTLALHGPTLAGATQEPFRLRSLLDAYRPLFRHSAVVANYAASFTRAVSWMGFMIYMGAFLHHTHGADARIIGLAYMGAGAGFLAGSVMAGEQLKNFGLRAVYAVASVIMTPLFFLTLVYPPGLIATIALLTVVSMVAGMTAVCLTTLLAEESPAGSATTMGFNNTARGLGTACGAALGGALIAAGGYPAFGVGMSLLLVISTFLIWQPGFVWRVVRLPQN